MGVHCCFLLLFTLHLVLARTGFFNGDKSVQCPSLTKTVCSFLKGNWQRCESNSVCPYGARCCYLACGNYCWPQTENQDKIDLESSSNMFTKRKKRYVFAGHNVNLQNPLSVVGALSPTRRKRNIHHSYPANLPDRFAPYPMFRKRLSPVPPPVAEFVIVGRNATVKLVRSNTSRVPLHPLPVNGFKPTPIATVLPRSGTADTNTEDIDKIESVEREVADVIDALDKISLLPSNDSVKLTEDNNRKKVTDFSEPSAQTLGLNEKKAKQIPSNDNVKQMDDDNRNKTQKVTGFSETSVQDLSLNEERAKRLRLRKLLEELLKRRKSKIKMTFHLGIKKANDSSVGHEHQAPVRADGSIFNFVDSQGKRIPYTWSTKSRSGTSGSRYGELQNAEKSKAKGEFHVYIWYDKNKKSDNSVEITQPRSGSVGKKSKTDSASEHKDFHTPLDKLLTLSLLMNKTV